MLMGLETQVTETVAPPETQGRYRKRMNTSEVIDAFIRNNQSVANSGNLYLDRGVLYSYGRHWPLARWVRLIGASDTVRMLIRYENGSVTTSTKHRSPLINCIANHGWFLVNRYAFIVDDVMADTLGRHKFNYEELVANAALSAEKAFRGPKTMREGKARFAVERLFLAFDYANMFGLTGKPSADTPPGVLADWLGENMPELTNLRRCAASLCHITGSAL